MVDEAPREDVHPRPELDGFADAVRQRLGVPVALVSIVESPADRQVFPGMSGALPSPWGPARCTPLSHSVCRYVVHDRRPLVITDAREDPRLRGTPAVEELGVIAYAGFPLTDSDGVVVGSLCAIDHQPREWTAEELADLELLAEACSTELQRGTAGVADDDTVGPEGPDDRGSSGGVAAAAVEMNERSRLLLGLSEALAETVDVIDVARVVSEATTAQLGCSSAGLWLLQTEIPRAATSLPDGVSPSPDLLCWVHHDDGDPVTTTSDRVPLDDSSPVGAAATSGESVVLDSQAFPDGRFPAPAHPWQEGGRRAFLPLISRSRLLGTLVLVWPGSGPISTGQMRTVTALASYTAQAVERASLRQHRADALVALQRSLMPTLPTTEEVELAARYLPASAEDQIGGDWYDALAPASGYVELMIGDVMGHDVSAAASMGQFRTMLRVLASTIDDGPAAQVTRLDRALVDLDIAGMATLVHGRLHRCEDADPGSWEFVWSNAGHLPPLLLLPSGEVRLLDVGPSDVFVGVMPERPRHDHRVQLPAGSTLLLYTDGLVERRGERLDHGLARLLECVRSSSASSLDALMDELMGCSLPARRDDDVAMLAVRLPPAP